MPVIVHNELGWCTGGVKDRTAACAVTEAPLDE
jgi:hypothetical protein